MQVSPEERKESKQSVSISAHNSEIDDGIENVVKYRMFALQKYSYI